MKILLVIDSLGSGGSQRQMVNLAAAYYERGNDVSFLVYHPHNFYGDALEELGINVYQICEPNCILRLLKMRRTIRASRVDVVLSFLEAPNFICELAGLPWREWKLVVGERSANPRIVRSWRSRAFRFFHFFADKVVTNTYENANLVKKANPFLKSSKLQVIYNIVDFNRFYPSSNYSFRKNGYLTILVLSSHQYLKNLSNLIESLMLLNKDKQSYLRILWYGDKRDDSFDNGYQRIIELRLGNIFKFYPATKEISLVMQQADVVGIFSYYEGLPNVICEAMACGKLVLSSAIGDLPMHIRDPRFLFEPQNPQSIALVLSYLLSLSEEEFCVIGKSNYLYARETFSEDLIVNEYLKVFQQK